MESTSLVDSTLRSFSSSIAWNTRSQRPSLLVSWLVVSCLPSGSAICVWLPMRIIPSRTAQVRKAETIKPRYLVSYASRNPVVGIQRQGAKAPPKERGPPSPRVPCTWGGTRGLGGPRSARSCVSLCVFAALRLCVNRKRSAASGNNSSSINRGPEASA